ncbi:MAG: histidine phosphatase family protein [Chloroflexi bacterium]|nr:MAG: histidine phosphatase family protein [Chloroflexota bacterium]
MELVYETHSTTTDNENGIATGWLGGRLSEEGRRQAAELGERRRDDGLAAAFVSDLARAVETAEIALAGSGVPCFEDARLRECDYGELNGMPVARLAADRARRVEEPWPGGESYQQVVERTREFLREVAAGWSGQRVLVISHSANRWALQSLLEGADLRELVAAPFDWRPGWEFEVPAGWPG